MANASNTEFWFDSSGKSYVSIRHTGVSIIDNLKSYPTWGLEESVFTSGFVKGYIDADFLCPLPSRTSFEENDDWLSFLVELDKIRSSIEYEVKELREEEEEKKLSDVQKQAIAIAKEILELDQFKDLELLKGLRRHRAPVKNIGLLHKTGRPTGERSKEKGTQGRLGGLRISYSEEAFADGPTRHSEFIAGTVRVNERNPDYKRIEKGTSEDKLGYAALMIGKEAISYNDKSRLTDSFLEKFLSYLFQVNLKIGHGAAKRRLRASNSTRKVKEESLHKQIEL